MFTFGNIGSGEILLVVGASCCSGERTFNLISRRGYNNIPSTDNASKSIAMGTCFCIIKTSKLTAPSLSPTPARPAWGVFVLFFQIRFVS